MGKMCVARFRSLAGLLGCGILIAALPFLRSGEFHLGYKKSEVQGISWYQLLHWDCTKEAQAKHRLSEYLQLIVTEKSP